MTAESAAPLTSQLVEDSPDAMIFADREGVIRVWNSAAERIFGHRAEAALGQTLDLIVPERFREQHWTGYDRALTARATKYVGQSLPTRAMRADGTQITTRGRLKRLTPTRLRRRRIISWVTSKSVMAPLRSGRTATM